MQVRMTVNTTIADHRPIHQRHKTIAATRQQLYNLRYVALMIAKVDSALHNNDLIFVSWVLFYLTETLSDWTHWVIFGCIKSSAIIALFPFV